MDLEEKNKKVSREDILTNAQFSMIEITGNISGDVKDILYLQDKNERLEKIKKVEDELKDLISEVNNISESLNLDFEGIIKGAKK